MSIFNRLFFILLAVTLLFAGCSHPTRSPSAAPNANLDGARLSQPEVLRIAGEAATKHGYRLADYKDPQAHFEFSRKDKTWTVFYDGKVPVPGNHFLVWVDDRTSEAQVMAGQ
jgi:hypothetical protein